MRSLTKVSFAINQWVDKLDPKDERHDRHLLEALATCALMESVQPQLLNRVLRASDHRARAFATRIAGRWQERLNNPVTILARAADDAHRRCSRGFGQHNSPPGIRTLNLRFRRPTPYPLGHAPFLNGVIPHRNYFYPVKKEK